LLARDPLRADQIRTVTARVHQGALDVLGRVTDPGNVHQAKFSMGTVLGLIAVHGRAGLDEFETYALGDPRVVNFRSRVSMVLDPEVDAAYPRRWIGKVDVTTTDGRTLAARVDTPKGDPGNSLSRAEIADKAIRLARYRGAATEAQVRSAIERIWRLGEGRIGRIVDRAGSSETTA
jgi:2-methylcitrate dehydratase PrpD